MNFKAYDIFAALIPGFLLLLLLIKGYQIPYDKDLVLCYTAAAYLLGHLVNTIASWLEPIYFFTWGGKPSNQLLAGKAIANVKIYDIGKIREEIHGKISKENATNDELFAYAMRHTLGEKDTRIEDFNIAYAFSRTLLTVLLTCVVLIFTIDQLPTWIYVSLGACVLICWQRAKERGFYYAKEVLNVYAIKNGL